MSVTITVNSGGTRTSVVQVNGTSGAVAAANAALGYKQDAETAAESAAEQVALAAAEKSAAQTAKTGAETAQGLAEDARDAAQGSAAAAALFDGPWVDDVAALQADTALTYSAGNGNVSAGDIVRTRAEGFSYEVVASGATDQHLTTAGGVKVKVLPDGRGAISAAALGVDKTGATDCSAAINGVVGDVSEVVFPAGTYFCQLVLGASIALRGAGEGLTVLTSEALTGGTTLTTTADLTLRDLTVKCHPTSASAKTLSHATSAHVQAEHVTFTGANHSLATHVSGTALYRHCTVISGASPNSLGALCHSPGAVFRACHFEGGRTIEAKDSKFYRCTVEATDNAVHIPDGALGNDGLPNGFSGVSEWYDCRLESEGTGITCGNAGYPKLRRCTVLAGTVSSGKQAFYARSQSTLDAEDCEFVASNSGTGVSFSDLTGPGGIARAGESVLKRCRIEGDFTSLAIPATSDTYPAAIGNVRLVDCDVIGGDDEISPKTSFYYIFETEQYLDYADAVVFDADNITKRFRFKKDGMKVSVYGSDAAKTGCHLSHLDAITGLPHPDGMKIQLRYGGTSSRFVTFATGATDDGGAMYFADDASTLTTGQQKSFLFFLDGTSWRQADG